MSEDMNKEIEEQENMPVKQPEGPVEQSQQTATTMAKSAVAAFTKAVQDWVPVMRDKLTDLKNTAMELPTKAKDFVKTPTGKITLGGLITGAAGLVTYLLVKSRKK